jgi:CHAD domain-containing protein
MSKAVVSQGFVRNSTRIRMQMAKLRKEVTFKNLHNLRVSVKKMDALLVWYLCFMEPADALQLTNWFAKLRPLYKKVGKIRSLQIILKDGAKLKIWDDCPQLGEGLQLQAQTRNDKLRLFLKKYRFPTIGKLAVLLEKYDQLPASRLYLARYGLLVRQQNEATAILSMPANEHWHAARRLLKLNYYVAKTSKIDKADFSPSIVALWSDLGELLGKWHDWQCFVQLLDPLSSAESAKQTVAVQADFYVNAVSVKAESLDGPQPPNIR